MTSTPTILCPLEFEARALAPLQREGLATVLCTGPGPRRVATAVANAGSDAPLVLAGLATALTDDCAAGDVVWANRVCGIEATPTLHVPASSNPTARGVAMCAVRDVLPDRPCRLAVARATNAQVADLECQTFAAAASDRKGPWGIVRGISDDINAQLPPVETLVDAHGRTRPMQVARWLAIHPGSIGRVIRLGRDATTAMMAVRRVVVQMQATGP